MGGKNNFFNQVGTNLGLMGTKGIFGGANQLDSGGKFQMTPEAQQGEQESLAALRLQASGQSPSVAQMQYNQALQQAAMAQNQAAASARGVNPALAYRAASDATMQAQAQAAGQSALMAEEERRAARQALIQAAAGQRGVALNAANANLGAQSDYRGQTFSFLGSLGGSAASASTGGGGKKGAGG